MSALSDIVAKFRTGSPNIARAFDEVERRLVALEKTPVPDPDPDPQPGQFGGELPQRNRKSTGSVIQVTSEASLSGARPSPGQIVRVTQNFTLAAAQLGWQGTEAAPITLDLGGLSVSGGQLKFQDAWFVNVVNGKRPGASDGVKIEGATHHVEVDGVAFDAAKNMAINCQGPGAHHLQFWNLHITNGGDGSPTLNQDHGLYLNGIADSVVANCLVENQLAFMAQAYPQAKRLIITGCTARGRKPNSVAGGVYLGDGAGSSDHRLVGLLIEDSSEIGIWNNGQNNQAFDCIVRRAASSAFLGGGFTHCVDSDTQPAAGFVQAARYGLLPATFRDGSPRLTAAAGSEKV